MTANGGQSAPKNRPKEDGVQTCDPSRWKITKEKEREEKPTKTRREKKKMTLFPRHEESDDATREKAMKKGWRR